MKKKNEPIQETLAKLWETSKKEIEKISKEAAVLLKKGEKSLKKASEKSKDNIAFINSAIQKEKLYYQLGKTLSGLPKNKWQKNKKITSMIKEISKLNKNLKKKS